MKTALKKRKIALIEDDEKQQNLIKNYLSNSEFSDVVDLYYWSDPSIAIREFFNNDFDLVILDINLPSPLGFTRGEMLTIFNSSHVNIVYISSDLESLGEHKCPEDERKFYLEKPFGKKEFFETIKRTKIFD